MNTELNERSYLKKKYKFWDELYRDVSNLKHSTRRKVIKKFKRSQKRIEEGIKRDGNIKLDEIRSSEDGIAHTFSCGSLVEDLIANNRFETAKSELKSCLKKTDNKIISESNEKVKYVPENENKCEKNDDELPEKLKKSALDDLFQQIDEEVKNWNKLAEPPSPQALPQSSETWEDEVVEKDFCRFYQIVGACRYFDNCKKHHKKVERSCVLLIEGMFQTFGFEITEKAKSDELDVGLEYTDEDLFDDFEEFAFDVLPELTKFGNLNQFKVCCNRDIHLRGNVYVQYKCEEDAENAFHNLQGRFYNKKILNCRFVNIESWQSAICGSHFRGKQCIKGYHCNYLHVFPNPTGVSFECDKEMFFSRNKTILRSNRSDRDEKNFNEKEIKHRKRSNRESNSPKKKKHKKEKRKKEKKKKEKHKKKKTEKE